MSFLVNIVPTVSPSWHTLHIFSRLEDSLALRIRHMVFSAQMGFTKCRGGSPELGKPVASSGGK